MDRLWQRCRVDRFAGPVRLARMIPTRQAGAHLGPEAEGIIQVRITRVMKANVSGVSDRKPVDVAQLPIFSSAAEIAHGTDPNIIKRSLSGFASAVSKFGIPAHL